MLALAAAGCGGNTPTQGANDMMQLIINRDYGAAYDAFSSASPVKHELNRDDFISQMQASFPEVATLGDFNVTDEQIDGDSATVSWTAKITLPDGQEQPLNDKFQMVKEDGTWKVSE